MTPSTPSSQQIRKDRSICSRIYLVTGVLIVAFSAITWRLFDLQVRQHDPLAERARAKYEDTEPLPALRGAIRDRMGEYLAHDEFVWELHTDRYHLRNARVVRRQLDAAGEIETAALRQLDDESLFAAYARYAGSRLAEVLDQPAEELEELLASRRPIEVLHRGMTEEEAGKLGEFLRSEHISGVYTRQAVTRLYPSEDRLTLLLGGIRPGEGATWGLEKLANEALIGTPGERKVERDRAGFELPRYRGQVTPPAHGSDVFTTIDMNLQETTEVIIERAFLEYQPKSALAILVDPMTGAILSMACRPHLDRGTMDGNWRNLPVSDAYEPGSVMKIVAMAAALDAGKIHPNTSIDCGYGTYLSPELGDCTLTDCSSNLGVQPAWGVLCESSNIGTYKIARMVGKGAYRDALLRFGFGTRSGIGLSQEGSGWVRPIDQWTDVDFSRACIGYFVTATALQQVMAYSSIANGGTLLRPQIIDRVVRADGTTEALRPEPIRQTCSARTARQITDMLEKVVTEGTGSRAAIDGVRVAGKTGTRNVWDPKARNPRDGSLGCYRRDQQVVSFAGFAPVDNPRVACVVMLDNPQVDSPELQQGGLVAAPVFSELVAAALNHLDVRLHPEMTLTLSTPSSPSEP